MSSCKMNHPDSDEEVDLEVLRLAALKSRKAKFGPRVNHNNLIPIVPIAIETSEFDETKIKKEKISPPPGDNKKCMETVTYDESKIKDVNKENEDDKASNYSGSTFENDQDILSVDDKEEEDSLERLMDQLEAEISGKVPENANQSTKVSSKQRKHKKKNSVKKEKEDGADDEVELLKITKGKEPGAIIEIRESASPENASNDIKKLSQEKSLNRRSRSHFRSWSRSPFSAGRSYRRSRSPYWSRSPRRSKSPFRRSRSPYWLSRRSRSPNRISRSPLRRYRSPRKRSPYSRYSRSRSKSFDRRRSPWSLSPRRRSKSPFHREWSPGLRHRNNSPSGRGRRSFTPRDGNVSPRRRSRSPRRFQRISPFRRSKSPFRRSKSPFRRKSPSRRPLSPYLRRSKSPFGKLNSPFGKRGRNSKSPARWSMSPGRRLNSPNKLAPRPRSKSPMKNEPSRRSPRHRSSKDGITNTSPTPRRNRSPLRAVEKNKLDSVGSEKPKDRSRSVKQRRSLSRENNKAHDRQSHRPNFKRFSPSRGKKRGEIQNKFSRSPKQSQNQDKNKEENSKVPSAKDTGPSAAQTVPPDPILEARKKKFENFSEVDLSQDREISLKSIKEPAENADEDEDALTINLESNLWEESEESGDECESRFKSGDSKKSRTGMPNRTVLPISFRNLREGDAASRQNLLNKPLIEENRHEKFSRGDRWHGRRGGRDDGRKSTFSDIRRGRNEDLDRNKHKNSDKSPQNVSARFDRRSDRKSTAWSEKNRKEDEPLTAQGDRKSCKSKVSEKNVNETKDRPVKNETSGQETDDFDKLISDFEKELESDICLTGQMDSTVPVEETKVKEGSLTLVKQDVTDTNVGGETRNKKRTIARTIKINRPTISNKTDLEKPEPSKEVNLENSTEDGPEDYIEDDDFVLELSSKRKTTKTDEEDSQSDLRAVLSKRRNQRLIKVVNLQENVPTRLVQSAFQGLGNKKTKKQEREVQEIAEQFPFDKKLRNSGSERRRVLLLQREKNLSVASNINLVPEVKPNTTVYKQLPQGSERRKRKLQRNQDTAEDLMLNEEEGFGMEEEKQSRRFRLKRNVTLSSQVQN